MPGFSGESGLVERCRRPLISCCCGERYLEAAIGIEPMNKGFAVRPGLLSLSVMECHRPVFIDLFGGPCYSVILKIAPDPPQKSPQSISSKCEPQSTRLSTSFRPVDFSLVIDMRSERPGFLSSQTSARIEYLKSPYTLKLNLPFSSSLNNRT